MKSRRLDVSENRRVKSRRRYKEPSKISVHGRVYSESIPVDLVIEILSRLPAKSIARCRCVSKLWVSILHRPYFAELFLTISQARPQLLFTCHKRETSELFFFSSPQPQYSDGKSSFATASYQMKLPFQKKRIIWHTNGLVILNKKRILEGRTTPSMVSIVCNPSTGQSLALPKLKRTRDSSLGYDPIEKQFKVLSMTATPSSVSTSPGILGRCILRYSYAYQVLTLGTKKMSWRKVECCIPHFRTRKMICINGVLYYEAYHSGSTMIVCFDFRSEKFCFMEVNDDMIDLRGSTLINYKGKLGFIVSDDWPLFSGTSTHFELWILEDTEKHEWSKHIHVLPPLWKDVLGDNSVLDVVGMVGENEIVFSPHTYSFPYYVFYYNIERNTIRRVEIQGLEGSKGDTVCTFLNHVEDIKPIDGY